VADRLQGQDRDLAVSLQLRTLVPISPRLDPDLRKIERGAQFAQLVGMRVAERHPHEPFRLFCQSAGIARVRRLEVTDASDVVHAIDDHREAMMPARPPFPRSVRRRPIAYYILDTRNLARDECR
jgi:hypothetical protein